MVAWDCPTCGGSGKRTQIVITGTDVEQREVDCTECHGQGFQSNR